MNWPWVSRRALEIREQQLETATKELDALKLKYEKLMNQFVLRATGAALDPDLLPEQYRRRAVPVKQEENPLNDPKEKATGPVSVRDRIKAEEEKRMKEFNSAMRKVTPIDQQEGETA